jgi:hypothetical protein
LGPASGQTRPVPTILAPAPGTGRALTQGRAGQRRPVFAPAVPAVKAFADVPTTAGRERKQTAEPSQPVITEELEVLREADAAVRAAKPARVLEVLKEAERRFAPGELGEEREALGIVARCKLDLCVIGL